MIAWLLWFFLALPLFMLDGFLTRSITPLPALTLALALFLGLHARATAVPGLLICAGLARAVLMQGDAAAHVLVLGVPVLVLVALRGALSSGHWLWQAAAAALLALCVPKLPALLARFGDAAPLVSSVTGGQVLWAAVLVPFVAALLRWLPPLSSFTEASA